MSLRRFGQRLSSESIRVCLNYKEMTLIFEYNSQFRPRVFTFIPLIRNFKGKSAPQRQVGRVSHPDRTWYKHGSLIMFSCEDGFFASAPRKPYEAACYNGAFLPPIEATCARKSKRTEKCPLPLFKFLGKSCKNPSVYLPQIKDSCMVWFVKVSSTADFLLSFLSRF